MRPVNRIITRGMGTSRGVAGRAGLITQGYGGIFKAIKEVAVRAIKTGQSGAKRALQELEEIIVYARLIRINDSMPEKRLQGYVVVKIDKALNFTVSMASSISAHIRNVWQDFRITVKRIK